MTSMTAEKSQLLAYLKHTPGFEHRIGEFQEMRVDQILENVQAADPQAHQRCVERFREHGTELAQPTLEDRHRRELTRLRDRKAGKILNWTLPYLTAAAEETRLLAEPEWRDEGGVAAYVAKVERAVTEWDEQRAHLLPASWSKIADMRSIVRCATGNMMVAQFEEQSEYGYLTEEGLPEPGEPQDTLAGIDETHSIRLECAAEQIHEGTNPRSEDTGVMTHLSLQNRIERLICIAEEIMGAGHAAITGAAVHAMAAEEGTTSAEPPAEDSLAKAAQTMAFAGAVACAAATTIDELLWKSYEEND